MHIEALPSRHRRSFLTPMVDVVFLLLLYFMLVSHYQNLGVIPLNAPATTHSSASSQVLMLRILEQGTVSMEGASIDLNELDVRLRNILRDDPELHVGIAPTATTPLQSLVDVLERVRTAGVRHLTLVREE